MRYSIYLAIAAAALAGTAAAPASPATSPHVAVVDLSPFTIRATHFKPHERVRIVVSAPKTLAPRAVTATATGTFSVRYAEISLGACAAYTVRATGSLGSRATLRVMPECANGPTP